MKYENIMQAVFLDRPNRFTAHVLIDCETETVHVKNTGRCKELLVEGCMVYLHGPHGGERKTRYDLVAVEKQTEKGKVMVNMDSQIVNAVAAQWLKTSGIFSESAEIRREVTYGSSRFDIYVCDGERKAFIEVKGVTLERDGMALFPDAPTERGAKHLRELMRCKAEGYEAYVLFVVQMENVRIFSPNYETDMVFSDALYEAKEAGVNVVAVNCRIEPDFIEVNAPIEVDLGKKLHNDVKKS